MPYLYRHFLLVIVFGIGVFLIIVYISFSGSEETHQVAADRQLVVSNALVFPQISTNIQLIVLVCSTAKHRDRRNLIRQSFGDCRNLQYMHKSTCHLIFSLGQMHDEKMDENVIREAQEHNDIIICDLQESYVNITAKIICTYKWLSTVSANFDFMIKLDDDIYINVPGIVHYLSSLNSKKRFYGGVTYQGKVPRSGRHNVPMRIFSRDYFPLYCKGANYVLSSDLLPALVNQMHTTPAFPVEDAYTGVLMEALGVPAISIRSFLHLDWMHWLVPFFSDCSLQYWIALGDGLSTEQLRQLHKRVTSQELNLSCSNISNYFWFVRVVMSISKKLTIFCFVIITLVYATYVLLMYARWRHRGVSKRNKSMSEPCCTALHCPS